MLFAELCNIWGDMIFKMSVAFSLVKRYQYLDQNFFTEARKYNKTMIVISPKLAAFLED